MTHDTYEVRRSGPLPDEAFTISGSLGALWYNRSRYGEWVWHLIVPAGMMTQRAEDVLRCLDGTISVIKLIPRQVTET